MTPEEEEMMLEAQRREAIELDIEAAEAESARLAEIGGYDESTPNPDGTYEPPTDEQGNNTSGPQTPRELADAQLPNAGGIVDTVKDSVEGLTDGRTLLQEGVQLASPGGMQEALIGRPIRDLAFDAVGSIPGLGWIDDEYDKRTKINNPTVQKVRETLSYTVPSLLASGGAIVGTGGMAAPAVVKGLAALGLSTVAESAITQVSDQGTSETIVSSEAAQEILGKVGITVPDWAITRDSDSPQVRRFKNMAVDGSLNLAGDLVGFAALAGKPVLKWFKPLNKQADNYIKAQKETLVDADTAKAIDEIDQQLASDLIDNRTKDRLQGQKQKLLEQAKETGYSDATTSKLEAYADRSDISRQMQIDEDGLRALEADPASVDFNPNITSTIAGPSSLSRQDIPTANVARNMADVAAIKSGKSIGDPAPVLTTPMMKKGLELDSSSRNIVSGIAEEAGQTGRFSAVVDGFRYTKDEMGAAAWKIYKDIIAADSVADLRQLFSSRRDVKNILSGEISYINEEQATATGFAMRDLVNRYLGREVTETSARVMDTLGREIASISDGRRIFDGVSEDPDAVMDLMFDKLNFLMDEYGINKFIAGWTLQNKKWWKMLPGVPDAAEEATFVTKKFDDALARKKASNKNLIDNLKQAAKQDPRLAVALTDAFALTNGDVDTLMKLQRYVSDQLNPMGLIMSPQGGMNKFANGLMAVRYNNILSGLSAFRAGLGTASASMLKPINTFLGLGLEAVLGNVDYKQFRSAVHAFGALKETQKRALSYAWMMYKKANVDPESVSSLIRTDVVQERKAVKSIIDNVAETWGPKDFGKTLLYRFDKLNGEVASWPVMRWGTNAMVAVDAYNSSLQATFRSRFDSYDKVLKGNIDKSLLAKAEKDNYNKMFDSSGKITDEAVENASREIAMNLDDPVSSIISSVTSKFPLLKSVLSFPKTGTNTVKYASSYTPIALIPGISKYNKVLTAGDNIDDIKIALADHGIDFDTYPDAMNVYKNLRAEYKGRLAFSTILATGLMGWAMDGNVRSNGPRDPRQLKQLRDSMGYTTKTIKIGGKWVDYSAWGEPFDSVFSIVGDFSMYARDVDSPLMEDIEQKLAWTFAATFTNKTFVRQLEPLVGLVTGDEGAVERFVANEIRSYIPQSGALGVLAQAVDSARKNIHKDMMNYINSRLPGLNTEVPNIPDIFTGEPVNAIDNPFLRMALALSPVKVQVDGDEPWRQQLLDIGYDGVGRIGKDLTGQFEYPAPVMEELYTLIGQQQPWKRIKSEVLDKPKYQDAIAAIRKSRIEGYKSDEIETQRSVVFTEIDKIMNEARENAEMQLSESRPDMAMYIQAKRNSKRLQSENRLEEAKQEIEKVRLYGQRLGVRQ